MLGVWGDRGSVSAQEGVASPHCTPLPLPPSPYSPLGFPLKSQPITAVAQSQHTTSPLVQASQTGPGLRGIMECG